MCICLKRIRLFISRYFHVTVIINSVNQIIRAREVGRGESSGEATLERMGQYWCLHPARQL